MYTVPLASLPKDHSKALSATALGCGKTKQFEMNYFRLRVFLNENLRCLKISEHVCLIKSNSSVGYSL